ncbi:MAG: hypothetical protein LPK49_05060, partial [Bacteroidota bacterium]|nr:hypothetical protein [Bacteroidota bacterium]
SSCKRDTDSPNTNPVRPENFESLDVPSTFDWETNKTILISLTGFSTSVSNERGVITILDENDNVLYKGMHSPQLNFEQEILVPQSLSSIRVKFGVTDKVLIINGKEVSGTLLPELPEVL